MHADGGGLYLQVGKRSAPSCIFPFHIDAKYWHTGLGATHTVSLDEARELARECRKQTLAGDNPYKAREAERLVRKIEEAKNVTFSDCANEYLERKSKTWAAETAKQAETVFRLYLN